MSTPEQFAAAVKALVAATNETSETIRLVKGAEFHQAVSLTLDVYQLTALLRFIAPPDSPAVGIAVDMLSRIGSRSLAAFGLSAAETEEVHTTVRQLLTRVRATADMLNKP